MRYIRFYLLSSVLLYVCCLYGQILTTEKMDVKTIFQTGYPWKPTIDIRSDMAVIYGIKTHERHRRNGILPTFEQRVHSWREKGYKIAFMTGISWGEYHDYFEGEWDGKKHLDDGQKRRSGEIVWHGTGVPYVVPTREYIGYLQERHIKVAIDAGIDVLFLEEPEFWAFSGYSEAFKREWKEYYGFEWRPQDESAENLYLSNKLKYQLYLRAVNECCTYAKEYGRSKGRSISCYVATHSLVNYSQWKIVSPEASLASLPCVDGYIAQIWTGTARTANHFNGVLAERGFEGALIEYGSMQTMTAPTRRKVFFLSDPVEDYPRDWDDYTRNYQATFTAKLFYPDNNYYEVMPWPERVYEFLFPVSAQSTEKARIPRKFSTQLQVMINALNEMPLSSNKISGTHGISVLMGNSLMFQRSDTLIDNYDDPDLANFWGMTMPLLKRGVPVNILHIENTAYPETWKDVRTLIISYSSMKPLKAEENENIANWVKNGGNLIYVSCDDDPFQSVYEWWNTGKYKFATPSEHLFRLLGVSSGGGKQCYNVGKGTVQIIRNNPKDFVLKKDMDGILLTAVKKVMPNIEWKNNFTLRRGAYNIIAVMDESITEEPYKISGIFMDLFDSKLAIINEKTVFPGEQAFLYDVTQVYKDHKPKVLAAGARITNLCNEENKYSFKAQGPLNTTNIMRIWFPKQPEEVNLVDIRNQTVLKDKGCWDKDSNTYFLSLENSPDGILISFVW